jgi:hypothetical protein
MMIAYTDSSFLRREKERKERIPHNPSHSIPFFVKKETKALVRTSQT